MRALIQRVLSASVSVDGEDIGQTGTGLLILVCAMDGDDADTGAKLAEKISKLRIFKDNEGRMNKSVVDIGGSALVVSQFTLAADASRGNRPGFSMAARPEIAEPLYLAFAENLRTLGVTTKTGRFGADMQVALTNDGPVTIWLDTKS